MLAAPGSNAEKLNISDLNHGICAEIISHIDFIHGMLMKASYPARAYTATGVQKLLAMDEASHALILKNLSNWKSILMDSSTDIGLETANEVNLAHKALKHFRLNPMGFDWTTVAHEEIIEIYSNDGTQLYRSLNFFSICGYSLLDLCVNKWFELWERPSTTLEAMNKVVGEVIMKKKVGHDANVAPHLVRETYDDGTTQPFVPRATIVYFRKIFPVYSPGSSDVAGFVITSTGKPISVGAEAMGLGFI